jgi:DNA-binding HxlR family transcriptional regulator
MDKIKHSHADCQSALLPIRDALEVISGKWKLQIIISISSGNKRFREIERSIPRITSKVLAKELKDLEGHQLLKRTVYDSSPVLVEYEVTPYSKTLDVVIEALHSWGSNHRKMIMGK